MPSNLGTLQPLDISYVPLNPANQVETKQQTPNATPTTEVGDMLGSRTQTVITESGAPVPSPGINRPGQVVFR
jgi:hypothetical protein